jgi:hypothetical protein
MGLSSACSFRVILPKNNRQVPIKFGINILETEFLLNRYKNPVRTSHKTHYASITKTNRLALFGGKIAAYSDNHTKRSDAPCWKNAEF